MQKARIQALMKSEHDPIRLTKSASSHFMESVDVTMKDVDECGLSSYSLASLSLRPFLSDLLTNLPTDEYARLREVHSGEAKDATQFALIAMKACYDAKHRAIRFKAGDKVLLLSTIAIVHWDTHRGDSPIREKDRSQ